MDPARSISALTSSRPHKYRFYHKILDRERMKTALVEAADGG
jgi:hypothetical protein